MIISHALAHPMAQRDDPWKVRVMPRVAFGVHPSGIDGLTADERGIATLHHFLGSWRSEGLLDNVKDILRPLLPWLRGGPAPPPPPAALRGATFELYPVSASFEPPFAMLTHLVGRGDPQAGVDVSHVVSSYGSWQPALSPSRKPSVADALVGALGSKARRASLVDVGAGHGFFSLAAAARGHLVRAFEASPNSLAAFTASVAYNGFEPLVGVRNVSLGARAERICVQRAGAQGAADAADVHLRRGYGDPAVHALRGPSACARYAERSTLAEELGDDSSVGALRISANGHEGWVLDGAAPYLARHRPELIYFELAPSLMQRAGYARPARALELLYALGYRDVAHAGYVCDERWMNVTTVLRQTGSFSTIAQEALAQPTWCKLRPEQSPLLVDNAHDEVPENLVFIYRRADGGAHAPSPPRR